MIKVNNKIYMHGCDVSGMKISHAQGIMLHAHAAWKIKLKLCYYAMFYKNETLEHQLSLEYIIGLSHKNLLHLILPSPWELDLHVSADCMCAPSKLSLWSVQNGTFNLDKLC